MSFFPLGAGIFIFNLAILVVGVILIIRLFKAMNDIEQIKNSVQQMEKKMMTTVQKTSPAKKALPVKKTASVKKAVVSTKAKK